jgi:lactate permease
MSLATLALAGGVPIVIVFVLLVGLRWSAAKAMGVGWLLASTLGLLLWRMETAWWAAAAIYGALQAVEIVLIVFGAILLMNHLEGSGAVATIRSHFTLITRDRRVQVLLIGLGFITLIEGAAGFGTPGALAAPLMIGLGFPALAAAVFGLMFNAPQPPFGAAGTPVIGGIGAVIDEGVLGADITVPAFLADVTAWTAVVTASVLVFWGLLGVFLLLFWFGRDEERTLRGAVRGTLPVAPFALLLGALAGVTQFAVAWFFGPELPNIAAGFVVLGVGVVLARRGVLIPEDTWEFPERVSWPAQWLGKQDRADAEADGEETSTERDNSEEEAGKTGAAVKEEAEKERMSVLLAWTPYLLVALVLVVTRWPGLGIDGWLRERSLDVEQILGEDLSFSLRYLYLPGVIPFIPVAVLTALLHRMDSSSVATAWRETAGQIVAPAVTLIVAVSMTQVMIQSATNPIGEPGMMEALSEVVALGAGTLLPLVAPWIGALGAFMTGSSTSSNVLFGVLQHDAAADVGVSRTLVVALQNVGGGIGNMLAVLNIAAICGVIRMTGMEGVILRKTLVPTVVFAIFAGAAGLALVFILTDLY